jgi:uncharacterized spore protein YtfJ
MTETNPEAIVDRAAARTIEGLNAVLGEASPGTIFSEPATVGEDLIVTASAWDRAGGFGFGGGGGGDAEETGVGFGAGGGGAAQGRPVAVIRIGTDGVEVTPVLDLTKIAVTALLAAIGVWRVLSR